MGEQSTRHPLSPSNRHSPWSLLPDSHVSPVNAPNHCLSASERSSPNATFVSDKCSDSDDSSQLFQYFSLTKQPASSSSKVTYYLQFEPTPEQERGSSDFPGAYSLGKATKGDEHVVALKYSEINSTPDNTYGFQLN